MFQISKEIELTTDLLYKMMNKFTVENLPKLQTYKNYYDGNQAIKSKTYSDSTKACNKTVTNYCKNISDLYCGYLASAGYISYSSDSNIEDIMDILRYNDYQDEDSSFLLDALVYGTAAELMYIDEAAKVRFKLINPLSCFGIYDNSLTNDLLYFVRWYKANEWDNSNTYNVDVYSDNDIKHYRMSGLNGGLEFIGEDYHYFGQCPANIFYLPDEKPIFDCIKDLQDSYNEILAGEIDDYSAFVDAFLTLTGLDADNEDVNNMKENRVLLLPEGSEASWLTKNSSDAQTENLLKRIHDSIYRIASCPDFSNDTFNTAQSGIAIRFKLTGMETRAAKIAALMKKALQRRIEIICSIATLKLGEEVYRDIKIDFKRNVPEDYNSTMNLINGLKGTVSDETLLGLLPFVSDVNAEIEAVKAQKQANIEMYGFGGTSDEDTNSEE